ncbi:hypothetical protein V6N13_058308 [Hibiscus sabdariffa]|uniref:Uncharacterized protein n=1 Tax=Hibiscus sabdariffa TaxID=183260 RepID=A0ABR2GGJ4_9ROSI
MDSRATEGSGACGAVGSKRLRNWDQIQVPGLHPSMSMNDLMNHIEQCLSEQTTDGNPSSQNRPDTQEVLEEIAQYLFSDNLQQSLMRNPPCQGLILSDEKSPKLAKCLYEP